MYTTLNTVLNTATPHPTYLSASTPGDLALHTLLPSSGTITISNSSAFAPHITGSNGRTIVESGFKCRADAEFEGDIKIKGKSLIDSLSAIEERLTILHPNKELEEKWENLRGLRKAYMELEAEIIEKEKIWSILKG